MELNVRKWDKVKFLGTFEFNLDNKNRLAIPAKWRDDLGKEVIISKGYEGCLELRSKSEFNTHYENNLANLDLKGKNARLLLRQMLANAADLDLDKASRILIPTNLLKEANINHKVTLIGLGNMIEIWSQQVYIDFKQKADVEFESASESL